MKNIEIRTTNDGSVTLYNRTIQECYHSMFGARNESTHIFIDSGLKQCHKTFINVLEVGFGTGLNAFLTALEAQNSKIKIHYNTLELYPLNTGIYSQLTYAQSNKEQDLFMQLHTCEWTQPIQITPYFSITKLQADLCKMEFKQVFDCVFFDAFSPEIQPELWTTSIFKTLYEAMNSDGILTTYCAKGSVRRTLQNVGFVVERIPGPVGGKREILRARK
ncbi:MAG TPA: tRNA (5-methylaminomethyl-2-thiouridine)(34)-methyltransferase MnmD [Paludibacteraceae bacterium]|nr:tRNA (5-methylaminomethyl-2-thiouridine)(34)-methyltransferase MnmD [Paludibacteraceae bacterium]